MDTTYPPGLVTLRHFLRRRCAGRSVIPRVHRVLVVTGTGPGVGKTVVTAAIAALAVAAGCRVAVLKPAQTGVGPGSGVTSTTSRGLVGDGSGFMVCGQALWHGSRPCGCGSAFGDVKDTRRVGSIGANPGNETAP